MSLDHLATELVLQIFRSCNSVSDVFSLSLISHRYNSILQSQKLSILRDTLERECGPLSDAIQLVTQNPSQPAQIKRDVPLSLALLKQVHAVGAVANKWEALYPHKKWKINYAERRTLTAAESRRLRRAVYRIWLYDKEFHTPEYTRETRRHLNNVVSRMRLLRTWTSAELDDVRDVQRMMLDVVSNSLCPSNSTIVRKFRKRFTSNDGTTAADLSGLMFNIHLNYPSVNLPPEIPAARRDSYSVYYSATFQQHYYASRPQPMSNNGRGDANNASRSVRPRQRRFSERESWGDEIQCYYIVQDMLKLNPQQIMYLRETAACRADVEAYIAKLTSSPPSAWASMTPATGPVPVRSDWFENNGETLGETIDAVLQERGIELVDIGDGEGGVIAEESDEDHHFVRDASESDVSDASSDED
jgi:hypothetical protein